MSEPVPTRPFSAAGSGEHGFTLIELLVALALMGMAASLLLLGLQSAGLVALRERATASGLEEVIATQRLLRTSIERLRPISRVDTSEPIVDLRGTKGILTFVAPSLDRSAPDALQRFRLTRTASGELVLFGASTRKAGIDQSGTDLVGWTPTDLLSGVANLSISYFGVPPLGRALQWQDRWWDRSMPPDLVRIRIDFAQGDRRVWPDLVIRPRATTNSTCSIEGPGNLCGDGR